MTREKAIHIAIDFCKANKIIIPMTVHAKVYVGSQNEKKYLDVPGIRWKVLFTHEEEQNIPENYFTKKELKKIEKQEMERNKPVFDGPYDYLTIIIVHPNGKCERKN